MTISYLWTSCILQFKKFILTCLVFFFFEKKAYFVFLVWCYCDEMFLLSCGPPMYIYSFWLKKCFLISWGKNPSAFASLDTIISHVLITRKWDHSDTQKCNTVIDQSQNVQLMQGSLRSLSTLVGVTSHCYFRYFFFFWWSFLWNISTVLTSLILSLPFLEQKLGFVFSCLCSLQADLDVLLWLMNSINNAQVSGLAGTTYS